MPPEPSYEHSFLLQMHALKGKLTTARAFSASRLPMQVLFCTLPKVGKPLKWQSQAVPLEEKLGYQIVFLHCNRTH